MSLRFPRLPLILLLALALSCASVAALLTGPTAISPSSLSQWMLSANAGTLSDGERMVLRELRLPRLLLALLIGSALACAGAVMQGLFRNPLAEPGLAGISGGAALAAVTVIVLADSFAMDEALRVWLLPAGAFIGGTLAALTVAGLARVDGRTRVGTLLLGGLALNSITGAGIGFLAHVADDAALRSLTFWLFGSLGRAGWAELRIGAPLLLISMALMLRHGRALDALLLGEREAGHLGVAVEAVKRRLLLLVVLATATAVALAGIIAFVGLITPHLIRLLAGPGHRLLLPASALLGALLLTLADVLARTLLAPQELAIGVLTSIVGGPFFLALLLHRRGHPDLQ